MKIIKSLNLHISKNLKTRKNKRRTNNKSKNKEEKNSAKIAQKITDPEQHKQAKRSIIGESGLSLLQEEAIDMIIQRDVSGMSYHDIADALDVNKTTLWRWRQNKEYNDVLLERSE